jgi:hypothetical protein
MKDGYRQAFGADPDQIGARQQRLFQLVSGMRSITQDEIDSVADANPQLAKRMMALRDLALSL